jgi:putative transposase
MSRDSTVIPFRQPEAIDDPLTEVAREGARRMLAQVLIAEADAFVAQWKDLKLPDGRDRVVRHGHGPQRAIQTGVGPIEVRRAKVRDRGDVGAAEKIRFTSSILPKWARRTKSLDALLPILYLRGVSTGDFQEALSALLGKDAPNLSPAVVARLTAEWQADYDAWLKRNLSPRRYVYVWADGVYLQARMEESAECMLVLIGATPEGKKELVGFQTGVRESAQSWRELLIDIKRRGLEIAPDLAVGDGALGFWKAIEEVFPGTKHQRCWVHKTANVLNKVALLVQVNMKADLREIYGAPTRAAAEAAIDVFADKYGAKYEKAVTCLTKDRSACLLRLPGRALGPSTHVKPNRERVRYSPSSDGADEGILVGDDRQVDGVQARHRGGKNLAAIEGRKPVAESRPRSQISKRHRGH